MTYNASETSQRAGRPVELYRFTLGNVDVRLTNAATTQSFQLQDYLPAPITRSSPTYSPEKVGSELQIDIALGDANSEDVANAFVDRPPGGLTRVVVFRVQPGGSATWWRGFVVAATYDMERVQLLCRPFSDIITKTAPRRGFGVLCQHVLFDSGCGLTEGAFAQTVEVTAVNAAQTEITVTGLAAPTVRFDGGTISRVSGLQRALILSESSGVITTRYPFRDVQVGDLVEIVEGCRHDLTDCAAFGNAVNYGGFPYTPLGRNPFARGLDGV